MSDRATFSNNYGYSIDGKRFVDTDLTSNVFYYSGGPIPIFENCTLINNSFIFQGAALNTLNFLQFIMATTPAPERHSILVALGLVEPNTTDDLNDG